MWRKKLGAAEYLSTHLGLNVVYNKLVKLIVLTPLSSKPMKY